MPSLQRKTPVEQDNVENSAIPVIADDSLSIRCDYPGGNIRILGFDKDAGIMRLEPDMRDSSGLWFHWDFEIGGAASTRGKRRYCLRNPSSSARLRGLSAEGRREASSPPSCSTLQPAHSRKAWYVQSQPYSSKSAMQSRR